MIPALPVVAWESAIVNVVAHLSIELIERYALRELSEIEIHESKSMSFRALNVKTGCKRKSMLRRQCVLPR